MGKPHFQQARAWLLLVLAAVLAACSGGGSGGSSPVAVSSGPTGSPVFSVKFVPLTPKIHPSRRQNTPPEATAGAYSDSYIYVSLICYFCGFQAAYRSLSPLSTLILNLDRLTRLFVCFLFRQGRVLGECKCCSIADSLLFDKHLYPFDRPLVQGV